MTNRGIDLVDESYNILRLEFPEESSASLLRDNLYFSGLHFFLQGSVSLNRILKITFLIVSILTFSYFFSNYICGNKLNYYWFTILSILIISYCLPGFWIERILTYNSLSLILSIFALSILFKLITIDKKNINEKLKLHLVIVSIILSLMIVFRPPNIIFAIIYYIGLLFIFKENILCVLKWTAFGFLSFLAFHFILIEDISTFIYNTKLSISSYSNLINESLLNRITRYSNEIFSSILISFGRHKFYLLIFFLFVFLTKKYLFALFLAFSFCLYSSFINNELSGGTTLYYKYINYISSNFLYLSFLLIYFIYTNLTVFKKYFYFLIFIFLFYSLPFILSLGTSNPITFNCNFFGFGFALCFFIILKLLSTNKSTYKNGISFCVFILTIGPIHTFLSSRIHCDLFSIFPINSHVLHCSKPFKFGYFENDVFIDPKTHSLLSTLKNKAYSNGFKKGESILNFTSSPGFVYALGGYIPVQGWTISKKKLPTFVKELSRNEIMTSWILSSTNQFDVENLVSSLEFKKINISNYKEIKIPNSKIILYSPNT